MLVVEDVVARWLFTAKIRADCAASCSFSVGIHGTDLLQAYNFTRTDYSLAAGDKVLLTVRRPFPSVGEVVDTDHVLKVDLLSI